MSEILKTDCLIIGTGLAGCSVALELAKHGHQVTMVTRAHRPEESSTLWAQGGIVYQSSPSENPQDLWTDVFEAGAKIGSPKAINILVSEGPKYVKKILIDELQVPFARDEKGELILTEEGAHSAARILFYEDATGEVIEKAFLHKLEKLQNVTILSSHTAIDLITLSHHSVNPSDLYEPSKCVGAYVLDRKSGEVKTILAQETVLATGGVGQLYLHTTNPIGSRGDGLAMAYRTGARIMNLEFIQFHPTALYQKTSERFLISEALRGEGAKLINHRGESFMSRHDPRAELAPRDIVSRAIHDEMLKEGTECVFLDIRHKNAAWIEQRFPTIFAKCKSIGINMAHDPIPVVPAAHYSCGGIYVDDTGNTTIQSLKAVGEVSCTGIHGANRLASTSLLEDLVWGARAASDLNLKLKQKPYTFPEVYPWLSGKQVMEKELMTQDWLTIKHTMWNYVGLVRTPKRLDRARRILRELSEEVDQFYANAQLSDELIGLRNGSIVAQLVLTAARRNKKSIGCHYLRSDEALDNS